MLFIGGEQLNRVTALAHQGQKILVAFLGVKLIKVREKLSRVTNLTLLRYILSTEHMFGICLAYAKHVLSIDHQGYWLGLEGWLGLWARG